MPDHTFNQIKQAEAEAQAIITHAKKTADKQLQAAKDRLSNAPKIAISKFQPKKEKLLREADLTLQEHQKSSDKEQKIALKTLAGLQPDKINRAVNCIVNHLLQK